MRHWGWYLRKGWGTKIQSHKRQFLSFSGRFDIYFCLHRRPMKAHLDVLPLNENLFFFPNLLVDHHTGWPFWLVPPRKVLSIELVPSNREKLQSSSKMAKIPTKKVKVHIRVCQTFTFCYNLAEKLGSDRLWLGLSLFLSRDIAIV